MQSYSDKYLQMKELYIQGKSLTYICNLFHADRGSLSKNLKKDGIDVINKQNLPRINSYFFDSIDCESKAYWLGFLYADGSISSKDNNIELSLATKDLEHLKKFRGALSGGDSHIFVDQVRCRFSFRDKHMKETLVGLGCTPKKSFSLVFPTYEQVPEDFIRHFVRGYIDGDGSVMIGKNHKGERVVPRLSVLGTKQFLEKMTESMGWHKVKITHPSGAYQCEWGGKKVLTYIDQLYRNANIYLDRKYQKYLELKSLPTINRGKNLEG